MQQVASLALPRLRRRIDGQLANVLVAVLLQHHHGRLPDLHRRGGGHAGAAQASTGAAFSCRVARASPLPSTPAGLSRPCRPLSPCLPESLRVQDRVVREGEIERLRRGHTEVAAGMRHRAVSSERRANTQATNIASAAQFTALSAPLGSRKREILGEIWRCSASGAARLRLERLDVRKAAVCSLHHGLPPANLLAARRGREGRLAAAPRRRGRPATPVRPSPCPAPSAARSAGRGPRAPGSKQTSLDPRERRMEGCALALRS